MFKLATRSKLRFATSKGMLTTEDLWDLRLEELNTLAKSLNKDVKAIDEEDFLSESKENMKDAELKLKFDIVLDVLTTKKEEREKLAKSAEVKSEKDKLVAILKSKEDDALKEMSAEDIRKKIAELG